MSVEAVIPPEVITKPEKIKKFPKAVFFILGNELCERYSYYGMRAVLTIYLKTHLLLDEHSVKFVFHSFVQLTYFTPLLGGLLADLFFGKFMVIAVVSVIYSIGNIFLSLVSTPYLDFLTPKLPFVIIALFIIAVGAGGIKPCVASFGGDQFVKGQETMRDNYFSIFYFCINLGAALSMIISPIFRADISCLGSNDCFPLAFGFPALLMVIALIIFLCGKPLYKIYPAQGAAIVDVARCINHAIRQRLRSTEKKPHWLDYADDKFDPAYIQDVKTVLGILLLFVTIPIFWALFDQQGSTWTLQSAKLDGRVKDWFDIHPDQMDSLNAILVLLFIPIFSLCVYPLLAKFKFLHTPIKKMCTGGMLAASSFIAAGILQLILEPTLPNPPSENHTDLMMINTLNCPIQLTINKDTRTISKYNFTMYREVPITKKMYVTLELTQFCQTSNVQRPESMEMPINVSPRKAYSMAIGMDLENNITIQQTIQYRKRHEKLVYTYVKFLYVGQLPDPDVTILVKNKNTNETLRFTKNSTFTEYSSMEALVKQTICWSKINTSRCDREKKIIGTMETYKGGVFDVMLIPTKDNGTKMVEMVAIGEDNIHILWQTPQYVLITAGEVLLSIGGLSFAYSQAPPGMKAVLQSAWLLTVALGNLIVMLVEVVKQSVTVKDSTSFFIFATMMIIDMIFFAILGIPYKYRIED